MALEVLVQGRVQSGPGGRVQIVRDRERNIDLYRQVTIMVTGRLYVGSLATSGDEAAQLYQGLDVMEISDLDLRWITSLDYEDNDPAFELARSIGPGDEVSIPCTLSYELPRRAQSGQVPRKLWTCRPLVGGMPTIIQRNQDRPRVATKRGK